MKQLLEWAKPWHDADLCVFIHPYTGGPGNPANPAQCVGNGGGVAHDSFRRVADAAATLAERGKKPVLLTYHAAELHQKDAGRDPRLIRGELMRRSVRFFSLGYEYLSDLDEKVLLTSETQVPEYPHEPVVRIGGRPEELVETVEDLDDNICWDTGHYLLGVDGIGLPARPPPEFVRRVSHMHVHDLFDKRDHNPLTQHSSRVAEYVAMSRGNNPSITLEYNVFETSGAETGNDSHILAHLAETRDLIIQWIGARQTD